ncbi:hypothetical protein Sango_2977700 [Sesamum angolense]|uniref:Uncharacterized protein n=1 Tax=Sesamum angolense TaxID=2727404 RepID=A0AAE1T507_9LAMI|nr:hypothetical protein Sango_2977700 [Sesamum angolense]
MEEVMGLTHKMIHGEEVRRTRPTMEMEEIKRLHYDSVDGLGLTSSNVIRLESSESHENDEAKDLGDLVGREWLDDVASILQRMKEVYAIPDRHTRYVTTKEFFRAKMTEGSFVQEHGVKMLSLVEKLEDLKARLENDTYIDVILQSLPPSYDPFIVNFNMNGLEKSINELINMLVQYEATITKFAPSVLIREASTSKVKGKRAGRSKSNKGKAKAKTVVVAKDDKALPLLQWEWARERRGWVLSSSRGQTISAPIAVKKGIGRGIVPIYLPIKVGATKKQKAK